jgi:hypothetical protein
MSVCMCARFYMYVCVSVCLFRFPFLNGSSMYVTFTHRARALSMCERMLTARACVHHHIHLSLDDFSPDLVATYNRSSEATLFKCYVNAGANSEPLGKYRCEHNVNRMDYLQDARVCQHGWITYKKHVSANTC